MANLAQKKCKAILHKLRSTHNLKLSSSTSHKVLNQRTRILQNIHRGSVCFKGFLSFDINIQTTTIFAFLDQP